MAINPTGAVGVPLTVFGGWVSEMDATSVPEGVSPDCQDVAFVPGGVYSRPCLRKVFSPPLENTTQIVYGKSFVTSSGDIKNLYLATSGNMYVEDFSNSPGTASLLFSTTAASYCKSVTAFGREWMAFSDGLHGTDNAYQWDGQYLDRVTQDGPGAPPSVASVALPSSTLAGSGGGGSGGVVSSLTLVSGGSGYIAGAHVTFSGGGGSGASATAIVASGSQTITTLVLNSGGSGYTSAPTVTITGNSGGSGAAATAAITGGGGGGGGTVGLQRLNNVVTATTTAAHGLLVGYQAQISNVPASAVGGGISSIVISNEDLPGEATVTTSTPHGLCPGLDVTITGVLPSAVGGGIATAAREGQNTTIVTNSPHGLVPGAVVTVSISSKVSFDGTFTVELVPNPTTIVYTQADADDSATGGTLSITWPIPDNTPTPTYFEVLSAPTPTTFTVQVNYTDGTWSSGSVQYAWNGIFYVSSVPSSTTFTYQQYGPNATSTAAGTVTPFGQCAPGLHLCQVLFETRQGYITAPSPPTTFIANGGQYVSVSNIPIGPPNVVARILAFTGAQPNVPGLLPPFFYIPVPAQLEGQTVSTATEIDDNTTTDVLLDFSDNTLFAAIGINVTGNTCANQIVLDGALGFSYFDSRVTTFGQRNCIQNLLNMGFDGGYVKSATGHPLGWNVNTLYANGILVNSRNSGMGWQIALLSSTAKWGNISQNAAFDAYGAPILDGQKTYTIRFWAQTNGAAYDSPPAVLFELSSASTGFSTMVDVNISSTTAGQYYEATFPNAIPMPVPPDLTFELWGGGSSSAGFTMTLDEMSLIDSEQPYLENQSFTSYVNNPDAFDGVTGNMQPTEDPHKIMDFSILRGTPYCHTQDPSGRLHEIILNPTSEPSGWAWKEVSANCGTLSAFAVAHSQADDETASGGDDWLTWPGEGGATIFDGAEPKRISQEIQPNWHEPFETSGAQINMQAASTIQAMNDPVERIVYFFLPIGTATTPSLIYTLSYRELNSAYAIANSPPFHPSLSGKLVATDNTRKWTRWTLAMNGAARMYRGGGKLQAVFFGGTAGANVYTLDPTLQTDDDYGQVNPYYITHAFVEPEKAAALGLGSIRLMLAYLTAYITGTGIVTYSYLCGTLANQWALTTTRRLSKTQSFDQEVGGGFAQGSRLFIKIASSPLTGTDNSFNLQRFQAWFRRAKISTRGAAT